MIYLFKEIENFNEFDRFFKEIPKTRQEKINRLKNETDKKNSLIAYLLLKYALKEIPEFSYTEKGKPYFAELNNIHFNFSHCKNGVVCAVSDTEIGVDIQDIRKFDINLAKRVCNDKELEIVENYNKEFFKLWSMKESIVKRSGVGIATDLKNLINDCKHIITTFSYNDFFVSACDEKAHDIIEIKNIV